jgi:hypothetical protein
MAGIGLKPKIKIKTIYGQLQVDLQEDYPNIKIEPAPDKWDRLYNVDFFILINENYIGIQIKPAGDSLQLAQIFKEKRIQEQTHISFNKKFGGKVFYIYSIKDGKKKVIANSEVIDEIKKEIERLKKASL